MRKHVLTATLYTFVTSIVLGLAYPLLITGVAHLTMRSYADGQLLYKGGKLIGSSLLGQSFTGPGYFHSRPSAAGTGYDAGASSGSNYGPTNKALIERVEASMKSEHEYGPVPVDLVTASASGLDPDITPAAALYQASRIARERNIAFSTVNDLINRSTTQRQFGLLGEPRVNVLQLNLALDAVAPRP